MKTGIIKTLVVILAAFLFFSCSKKADVAENIITVSILPQKYFAEKIAGSHYTVNVMVPPGASPEMYEPAPSQLEKTASSVVYFRIGYIPFEQNYMSRLASLNPSMKIFDTSEGTELLMSEEHEHHGHEHAGTDPHLWLSPVNAQIIASNMLNALTEVFPADAELFRKNFRVLSEEIAAADKKIRSCLSGLKNRSFICFHPAFTYFADCYGLKQVSLEFEGKDPVPSRIKNIIDLAEKEDIHTVFVQEQFSSSAAEAIARDINGKVVKIDPLGENWPETMTEAAEAFSRNMK